MSVKVQQKKRKQKHSRIEISQDDRKELVEPMTGIRLVVVIP